MKKFIKGIDDWFIREDKINAVGINDDHFGYNEFNVIAHVDYNDAEFYLAEFDNKADAEAWLENFVAELNADDADFQNLRTNATKLLNVAIKGMKLD